MLSILNNISSLNAQNSLSTTQMNLQKTLTALSTGLKINSGSDDAAGLSIANGLQANISALTQSAQNASNGIGLLQTADGALSQVTTLLNRAVTLATEASNAGLTTGSGATQSKALDTEFQSIMSEINQIGKTTNFNGSGVFQAGALNIAMSDGTSGGNATTAATVGALTTNALGLGASQSFGSAQISGSSAPAVGDTVTVGGTTYTFVAAGASVGTDTTANDVSVGTSLSSALKNLADAINGTAGTNEFSSTTGANANVSATNVTGTSITIQASSTTISVANSAISATQGTAGTGLGVVDAATTLTAGVVAGTDLLNTGNAAIALTTLTAAINQVSAQRGTIGASVNQLTAASSVMTNEVQNLTSAQNSIQNADIGKTVANMTQYNVLQSTGMAALQQSNQAQQAVLKLLQ
jgi:flagellin